MKKKKILYIKAQGFWDIIGWIPFLATMKEKWYEIYQTFYDMRYLNKSLQKLPKEQAEKFKKRPMYTWWIWFLEYFKKIWLIKDIIFIPYWYKNLIMFFIKNFQKFDEVVIPINTKAARIISYILGKKTRIIFSHTNEISTYRVLADGEVSWKSPPLYTYKKYTPCNYKEYKLPTPYITIFPSIFERSLEKKVWINVIEYAKERWFHVVIVWWDREKWFIDELGEDFIKINTISLLNKTLTEELAFILEHATGTISGNGGPMWLANLVNKRNFNIHTVSAYIMEPPVDNIFSFNSRPYHYNKCTPCEAANSTIGEKWCTPCVFFWTIKELECKKIISFIEIKKFINWLITY